MGYYMAGDYYAAGGILGSIFGVVKKAATGFISGGPLGAVTSVLGVSGTQRTSSAARPIATGGLQIPAGTPAPGLIAAVQRAVPGGATGMVEAAKRRRMNVANPKALRKAIRRQAGFVKLARRALKGTGYTIASRGSSRRRPLNIRETGPGSVTVR